MARSSDDLRTSTTDAIASGLPLPSAFRAMADECSTASANSLREMADEIESGHPLEEVLAQKRLALPASWLVAIRHGSATDRLPMILVALAHWQEDRQRIRRRVILSLVYPLLLLAGVVLLALFSFAWLLPLLSQVTHSLTATFTGQETAQETGNGLRIVMLGAVIILLLVALVRWSFGPILFRRLTYTLPIIGPALAWAGGWEFSQKLALFLQAQVPLDEALRIVAAESKDANYADVANRLAAGTERGQTLNSQHVVSQQLPATLAIFLRWGEEHDRLPESLQIAAKTLQRRLEHRSALIATVFPTILYVLVGGMALACATAVFTPMLTLMGSLRWAPAPVNLFGENPISGFAFAGLLGPGCILLWATHLLFLSNRHPPQSMLVFLLRLTGAAMIFASLTSFMIQISLPVATVMAMILGIVWAMVANRYRRSEARQLTDFLSVTQQAQIPIVSALRAFAEERTDELGIRVMRFAETLEQGSGYERALLRSRLPGDVVTHLWTNLLQHPTSRPASWWPIDPALHAETDGSVSFWQHLLYLIAVPVIGILSCLYVASSILPVLTQTLDEFGVEVPTLSAWVLAMVNAITPNTFTNASPLWTLLPFFLSAIVFGLLLYYVGWLRWEVPIFRPWLAKVHGAIILRALAARLANQTEVTVALAEIAAAYPTGYVRRRLHRVERRAQQGQTWIDGLAKTNLVSPSIARVLESAARGGNLSWALWEMADTIESRLGYRASAALQIATPIMLLLTAVPVGLLAVSIMLPLITLVEGLA